MILDAAGELACVGQADLRLASDLQIGTHLDHGGIMDCDCAELGVALDIPFPPCVSSKIKYDPRRPVN